MAISIDLTRKLPLGRQSFEDLIKDGCLYVDKTDYVYYLAHAGTKSYFLARPRRFGKSLMANTLLAYFEGKKELFKNLKICDYETEWTEYPICFFDFVDGDYSDPETLVAKIKIVLKEFEKKHSIDFDGSFIQEILAKDNDLSEGKKLSYRLRYDMEAVYNATGLKTVIIVDEYDNPLISSGNLAESKSIYRGFFSVLKSADKFIKFAFVTGVTKFAKTSIFSGQNQPEDITDDENFSAICGITHQELLDNFTPEIQRFAKKKNLTFDGCVAEFKRWYDCYLFHENGEKVFNPVSLINAFKKCDFQNYWYDTGNPSMLMKRIHSSYYDFKHLVNDVSYSKDNLKTYRDDNLDSDLIPLLYYSGYLTIKSYDAATRTYTLGFPNNEVELSFLNGLANEFYRAPNDLMGFNYADFLSDLFSGDVERLINRFKALYSTIPYANNDNDKWVERDFHNVIFLVFTILGQFIISEAHTSKGRADSIVITEKFVYIMEFKIDQDAQAALSQINEKEYAARFKMDGRKIFKIGINFSRKEKNIADYKVETVSFR